MASDSTLIRPATEQDIDGMVALLQELFSVEADFQFNPEKQANGLKLLLENYSCHLLVASSEERVIGMCSGQTVISTAEGGPALLVEDVVVAPEYRQCGIGRSLVETLALWAKNRGINRLQLLADKNNQQGLRFYDKTGWETTLLICLRKYST